MGSWLFLIETVETWLFAQGKAQPDVSDDVNRFYSPPQLPPSLPLQLQKSWSGPRALKNCTERKRVRLIAGYFTYEVPTPLPGATAVNGFEKNWMLTAMLTQLEAPSNLH